MTVISGGVAFQAVKSIDVENVPGKDSEGVEKPLGTPMLLQVSTVKTVVRPMTSEEYERAVKFVNDAKNSINDLYEKGKSFYDRNEDRFNKAKALYGAVKGVGDIYSGIKKFRKEEKDPMIKLLGELTDNVKELGQKMKANFTEMKNFISEQTFFTDIISPTAVLTMYMIDCLTDPGDDSKENFKMAYERMTPLTMQYNLNAFLMKTTTNPLKQSLEDENVKMNETFEKWEDIYSQVMAQYVLLEAYAGGLLEMEVDTNLDHLMDASDLVLDDMQKLRDGIETKQDYWNEMKKFLVPYLESHTHLNNAKKGAELKAKLEKFVTRDALYLVMFNDCFDELDKWFTYYCPKENDQLISSFNTGKCSCFIYRSRTAHTKNKEDYESIRSKVISFEERKLRTGYPLNTIIKKQMLDPKILPEDGFICLIEKYRDPQVFFVNSLKPDSVNLGPGHFTDVEWDRSLEYWSTNVKMLAAFP